MFTGISNSRIHQTTTEEYPDDDPANLTLCTSTVVTFTFKSSSSAYNNASIATKIPARIASYTPPPSPTVASSTSSLSTNSSLESLVAVSNRIKELEINARETVDVVNTISAPATPHTSPAVAMQSVPVVPSPAGTICAVGTVTAGRWYCVTIGRKVGVMRGW